MTTLFYLRDLGTRLWHRLIPISLISIVTASIVACSMPPATETANTLTAQTQLPSVTLLAGQTKINVQVADTASTREKGLMYRSALGKDEGMLFVFEDSATRCFWMKNTPLPLSIAYLDTTMRVISVHDLKPMNETPVCSAKPAQYAIEMPQGWFDSHGIGTGQRFYQPAR